MTLTLLVILSLILIADVTMLWLWRRSWQRPSYPRCPKCLYDLRGGRMTCPECGRDENGPEPNRATKERDKEQAGDYESSRESRNTLNASMQKYHVSLGSMSTVGANLVKTIRAFAEGTGNDDVYAKAMIPAPAKKTPQPAPGTAKNLTGSINNVGDVELTWNASVIQTTFTVLRRLTKLDGTPATSDWVWVGNTHTKAFTDSTVPAGYASASYRVYAERNGKQSPASSTVEMYFGSTQPSNGEVAGSIGTDDAMAA